ncbi:transposase [Oxobacter pfennigii]|uniref:Transposase n=1 Tax=Oxobacter pfennigii TaxID=36849 RepID=A0A0P8Z247_9CLOT|nr:transposase [Oxobacter pfennigii]
MGKQYSSEFKLEAVKRAKKTGEPITKVAAELGVKPTTMQGWVNKYRKSPESPFPGSGNLSPDDEKLRKLEREVRELKEENEILKKAAAYFAKNLK